jgi:hypothetical protein
MCRTVTDKRWPRVKRQTATAEDRSTLVGRGRLFIAGFPQELQQITRHCLATFSSSRGDLSNKTERVEETPALRRMDASANAPSTATTPCRPRSRSATTAAAAASGRRPGTPRTLSRGCRQRALRASMGGLISASPPIQRGLTERSWTVLSTVSPDVSVARSPTRLCFR